MENSRPGPDETEKSSTAKKAEKAEGVAAWLRHQREQEQRFILGDVVKDEEETKDTNSKKPRTLRFGALPIVSKGPEEVTADAAQESAEPAAENHVAEASGAAIPGENVDYQQPTVEQSDADFAQWQQEMDLAQAQAKVEELDFQRWEQELADAQAEADDFQQWEAQMAETSSSGHAEAAPEDDTDPNVSATNVHASRTSPPVRQAASRQGSSSPPVGVAGGGGGGGIVPPILGSPSSPKNPFGPYGGGGNPNAASMAPNILPVDPNTVLPGLNRLRNHEHEHGHPRLALAFAAGLLVEHMLGRRADKKIDTEMRRRTDKLREQIERSQATQMHAQRTMESQQIRLAAEQDRQRQILEQRPIVQSSGEAARPSSGSTELRPRQFGEQTPDMMTRTDEVVPDTDKYAEAYTRPKVVMEQVAAAAENDVAVERVYERRQEVRDEPSPPAGAAAGGAASVGSVLADTGQSQQYGGGAGHGATDDHRWDASDSSWQHDGSYRSAAVTGFGAALALIILGLLAYLLF